MATAYEDLMRRRTLGGLGDYGVKPNPTTQPVRTVGAGQTMTLAGQNPAQIATQSSPGGGLLNGAPATGAGASGTTGATPTPPATTTAGGAGTSTTTQTTTQPVARTNTPRQNFGDMTVAGQLADIVDENGILMQQAAQRGLATANARGLLNSSIAAGASQGAVLDRALPIAQQDAQSAVQQSMQATDLAAQMDRLRTQAGFTKELAEMDISAQMDRLRYSTTAEMDRLKAQLSHATAAQAADIRAQMDRLQYSSDQEMARLRQQQSGQSALQAQGNQEQLQRMAAEFAQQSAMQQAQAASALEQIQAQGTVQMQQQAATIQAEMQRLQMQLASGDRDRALNAATTMHQAAQALISSIMSNSNIDAASRQQWIAFAQQQAAIGLNLIEQLQNVNLSYGQSAGNGTLNGGGV